MTGVKGRCPVIQVEVPWADCLGRVTLGSPEWRSRWQVDKVPERVGDVFFCSQAAWGRSSRIGYWKAVGDASHFLHRSSRIG